MSTTEERASGSSWVLGGFLFFSFCNQLLRLAIPSSARNTPSQAWKWKNTAVSLIHSIITGTWSLYCFYDYPKLAEDLINIYTSSSHMLISFSMGYFIHDFLDMALWHRKRSSYELMVHHTCVITCFGLAVSTAMYLGYGVVALFVEVNSIFLHTRQLMNITGVSKTEPQYRLNAMVNIGTFVVFRIAVLGWMTRWIVIHRDDISLPVYTLGSVAMAIIMLMNIILFIRICLVDFSKKKHNKESKHKESKVNSLHKKILQEEEEMNGSSVVGASSSSSSSSPSLLSPSPNLHLS